MCTYTHTHSLVCDDSVVAETEAGGQGKTGGAEGNLSFTVSVCAFGLLSKEHLLPQKRLINLTWFFKIILQIHIPYKTEISLLEVFTNKHQKVCTRIFGAECLWHRRLHGVYVPVNGRMAQSMPAHPFVVNSATM